MKPLRGRDRLTRVLAVLMVLVYRSGPSSPSGARSIPKVSSSSGSIAQDLSSEGQTWLRALFTSGSFADLHLVRWKLPASHASHVHVNEVGSAIVAHSAAV